MKFNGKRICNFKKLYYRWDFVQQRKCMRIFHVRVNHLRNLLRNCFVYTCLHKSENSKSVYEQPAYFNKTYSTLLSSQHNRDFKMSNGFGTITWWGFSPAIDLQDQGN